jgi:hypothetical protein
LLRYSTAKDAKVRPEHAALDGVTLPVDDPFWDMYFPPNDWGCRCDVVQIANGKITDKDKIVAPENKPMFQNNVGKTGIIFPEKHPYYKVSKEEKTAIMAFVEENMPKIEATKTKKEDVDKELRKKVLESLKADLVNKGVQVERKEIKNPIRFTSTGLKEALNQPHPAYNEKNLALLNIVKYINEAKYLGEVEDKKGNQMIKAYHYLEILIKNIESVIVIREKSNGETTFYTISIKKAK